MKRLTMTARVALMCALITAAVAALAMIALVYGEQRMLAEYSRDTLVSAAKLARDEIVWRDGEIELDRNLDELPGLVTAVYSADGDLIYGRTALEAPLKEGVRMLEGGGSAWYVHDSLIELDAGKQVWLRLYMPPGASSGLSGRRLMLMIFPGLAVLAGIGGYFVARHAMRPVKRITATAISIAGGADLKKRIGPTGANDELSRLAAVFDGMLERLEGAFERERRFTADAAHELRTPVSAILAQAEFALSESSDDAERTEALVEIRRRALGMRELAGKLLLLSRMEADQITPAFETVDLSLIADMAAEALAEAAGARRICVHVDAAPAELSGDQTMLTQAVMNLMENAVRYGREGGSIWVDVSADDAEARVCVTDDGPGMTPEQAARAFERFYQADPSRGGAGAGLGLSLTRRIAQLHGGNVELETAPGKGCRFTITLPKGGRAT